MPNIQTFASTIATLNTNQQLPNLPLVGQYVGASLSAPSSNTANVILTASPTATTGYVLKAGTSVVVALTNFNQLYVRGAAADVVTGIGV